MIDRRKFLTFSMFISGTLLFGGFAIHQLKKSLVWIQITASLAFKLNKVSEFEGWYLSEQEVEYLTGKK